MFYFIVEDDASMPHPKIWLITQSKDIADSFISKKFYLLPEKEIIKFRLVIFDTDKFSDCFIKRKKS